MNRLEQELSSRFGARLRTGAPLAELTSFRIGGPADVLLTVEREEELSHGRLMVWRGRLGDAQYAKRQLTWFRREKKVHWFAGFGDNEGIQSAARDWLSSQLMRDSADS